MILMTDVPGVLLDKDDVSTKFTSLNLRKCRQLPEDGIIAGARRRMRRGQPFCRRWWTAVVLRSASATFSFD